MRSLGENVPFDETNPTYEVGREQVPQGESRTNEQIMENNPPFQSNPKDQSSYQDTAYSYLSWAQQKAAENASYAAEVV